MGSQDLTPIPRFHITAEPHRRTAELRPVFGLIGIGNSLEGAAGPWLSGAILDRTHSYLTLYLTTLGFAAAGLCALAVFLLTLRQHA